MTIASFSRCLATVSAFLLATVAFAQTATLKADRTALASEGGTVQLTAGVGYDGRPGAIGWSIVLPDCWTLVSVSGANIPEIAPTAGSAGELEFAYTTTPASRAEFVVSVRYPAGVTRAKATSTVLVRVDGKLTTLTPPAVELGAK